MEEIVNLTEIVNFRSEVEASVDSSFMNLPFYLKVDLMFAEAPETVIRDAKNIQAHVK